VTVIVINTLNNTYFTWHAPQCGYGQIPSHGPNQTLLETQIYNPVSNKVRSAPLKTKKASGMISSPSGSPKTLVYWRKISSPNSKGFPQTGASNKGRSEKFSDFSALSVNISKTVADTAKVTIRKLIGSRTWAFDW